MSLPRMKDPVFTLREEEIIEMAKQGYTQKEIAAKLKLAVPTVKIYVRLIIAKMGAKTLLQAIVRAIEQGHIKAELEIYKGGEVCLNRRSLKQARQSARH